MIGKLTSVENGPERNVELIITITQLHSAISSPAGIFDPHSVDHYEISGLLEQDPALITLTFVFTDGHRVRFYATDSKLDMVLLLDQLDGTIGERRREFSSANV